MLYSGRVLAALVRSGDGLRGHVARSDDQTIGDSELRAQRPSAQRNRLSRPVGPQGTHCQIDVDAILDGLVHSDAQSFAVLAMNTLPQLIPAEFRIRRPAELRFELRVGARAKPVRVQSAKTDARGRYYQLQLISPSGETLPFERRGAWAVLLGTGILVVN